MTIQIGTAACEANTVSGSIHDLFVALYGETAGNAATVKGVAYAIAAGIVEGMRTQIADGEAVGRSGLNLAGLVIGGGGGAPSDAAYLVSSSNGTLSAERVATNTATVTWDFAVAGQAKANVASIAGVSGLSVTPQTPASHATSHQNNGADEINVAGLSGELADPQPAKAHASSHMSAGSDPIRIDELKIGTDVSTLNASTTEHGLLAKLDASRGRFFSGGSSGGWVTVMAPGPYLEEPIEFSQAITSGVAFTVFETSEIPEGFAGVATWEYYVWGGTAGASVVGHTTGARCNLRRLTAGALALSDVGQTAALGENTTYTVSNAANGNNLRVQLTLSSTTTIYVRGWYRVYGVALA